jgi:acetoin utilization protein AcuB
MGLSDIRQTLRQFDDARGGLSKLRGYQGKASSSSGARYAFVVRGGTVMQVQDVMTAKVLTIDAHDTVARARARMCQKGVHQLVVTAERDGVVGIIGVADVGSAPDGGCVQDFMSRRLFIVRPDTSVGAAAALMRAHAIGSLPVLDGRRLVGIVTVSDMLDVVDTTDGVLSSV